MPIHVECSACKAEYSLKDEFAGQRVRCPKCQAIVNVPSADLAPVEVLPAGGEETGRLHRAFRRDKFLLRQKHLSLHEKYYVWDEDGETIMFVERPMHWGQSLAAGCLGIITFFAVLGLCGGIGFGLQAAFQAQVQEGLMIALTLFPGIILAVVLMAVVLIWMSPKRHITFYTDDTRQEKLLEVLQDQKFTPINATYTVLDPEGHFLARFRKNYLYNIIRKRWYCYGPDGQEVLVAKEDSIILSILRRLLGPMLGLLRTNFVLLKPDQETVLGEFNRKFTLLDRYVLDLSADRRDYLDRRLAIALGVLLDTGERR